MKVTKKASDSKDWLFEMGHSCVICSNLPSMCYYVI